MVWIVLIALALLLLACALYTFRKSRVDLEMLDTKTIPVNLEAFENLRDPEDTAYLRERLPRSAFRRVQRLRTRAALEYLNRIAHNARILQGVGEANRVSSDAGVAETAQSIVDEALRLRLLALRVRYQLYLEWLYPERTFAIPQLSEQYDRVRWRLEFLLSAKLPRESSRILAAL